MLNDILNFASLGNIAWLIVSFYLGFYIAFYFHEFGHYLVVRLCGFTPRVVRLSGWGPVYSRKHFGTHFKLPLFVNPAADGHEVRLGPGSTTRRRMIYMLVAGSATNLLTGGVLVWVSVWFQSWQVAIIAGMSIVIGISQILPGVGTDGQNFWNIVVRKHKELQ